MPLTMRETSTRSAIKRVKSAVFRSIAQSGRASGCPDRLRPDDLQPTAYRVQRRPQLVRQRGEELVLESDGFFGGSQRLLLACARVRSLCAAVAF